MLIKTPTAIQTVSWISPQFRPMVDLCRYSLQGSMWWRFYTKSKTLLITKNLRQLKFHSPTRLPVGICAEFYWVFFFSLPKLGPRFKTYHIRIGPARNYSQLQSTVHSSELILINRHISSGTLKLNWNSVPLFLSIFSKQRSLFCPSMTR